MSGPARSTRSKTAAQRQDDTVMPLAPVPPEGVSFQSPVTQQFSVLQQTPAIPSKDLTNDIIDRSSEAEAGSKRDRRQQKALSGQEKGLVSTPALTFGNVSLGNKQTTNLNQLNASISKQ